MKVQSFWSYYNLLRFPSHFKDNCTLQFFKNGIKPMWEDPSNKTGGKWTLSYKRVANVSDHTISLDRHWDELVLAMVGGVLDENDVISGLGNLDLYWIYCIFLSCNYLFNVIVTPIFLCKMKFLVLARRPKGDRIAIWTQSGKSEEDIDKLGYDILYIFFYLRERKK